MPSDRQAVNRRRLDLAAVATAIGEPHIVGHHDDDVWPVILGCIWLSGQQIADEATNSINRYESVFLMIGFHRLSMKRVTNKLHQVGEILRLEVLLQSFRHQRLFGCPKLFDVATQDGFAFTAGGQ